MYESVNVLGGATRTDFVQQCILKACIAGRLNVSPTFLHILSALIGIEFKRSREPHRLALSILLLNLKKMVDKASFSLIFKLRLLSVV